MMTDDVEFDFLRLCAEWKTATSCMSSVTSITNHPAYQQIIAMGMPVVPFILRDLQQEPRYWMLALTKITGQDPVNAADWGRMQKMADAWVAWGRANGLID